ncbi:MAG: hypothetical protein U0586_14470 [Candidatus Brocadiaceae bacterium]
MFEIHSAATPQPILLYEKGEIASEKTLAMTLTMHFDGTHQVVIASVCSDDFSRLVVCRLGSLRAERSNLSILNKLHLLIRSTCDYEILTKKKFTE